MTSTFFWMEHGTEQTNNVVQDSTDQTFFFPPKKRTTVQNQFKTPNSFQQTIQYEREEASHGRQN